MKQVLRNWILRLPLIKQGMALHENIRRVHEVMAEDYARRCREANPRYQDPKCLSRYECQIFSQNGEDGILREIFRRIGAASRFFIEIGVGDGLENNTAALLVQGWRGVWIEADAGHLKKIRRKFSSEIESGKLILKPAFVTRENVESLLREMVLPGEIDLLSIDIDGNDYWIWESIQGIHPRVVVIEYNGIFREDIRWVMKYNAGHRWSCTSYQGASLKSLELLGTQKGYKLVGCDFNGLNAFFVREDLTGDHFSGPFTAERHYEPPRYYHLMRKAGNPRDFGPYEAV